jgi:hypothetical protein
VVNLGVATSAHRDPGDDEFCLVITLQRCIGGGTCFYEPGIVVESCDGDGAAFPSCKVTHFNLHFDGIHSSLVLHSDSSGKEWAENYNRWSGHVY